MQVGDSSLPAFYPGLQKPGHAQHVGRCMLSVNVLRQRKSDFVPAGPWLMDSGAFTSVLRDGCYREPVDAYAAQINRWATCGQLAAAVAQDYICEDAVLQATGLSVQAHQQLSLERYDALLPLVDTAYVMPVLQGREPGDYVQHLREYGPRIAEGAWVGVGSVHRLNATPDRLARVLHAVLTERPGLRLHGFGVKLAALGSLPVVQMLASCDSMAWSLTARREGRNQNDWREAVAYAAKVEAKMRGARGTLQLGLAVGT